MPAIDITILADDTERPPWDDAYDGRTIHHLQEATWRIALLGGGMSSGLPSVALRLDLEDGSTVIAETSLAALTGVIAAARGRWPVAFAGGPFAAEDDGR